VSPDIGRTAIRIAAFPTLLAVLLLFLLEPGTAEYAITVITLLLGVLFILLVWYLIRRLSQ
jgi:heme O synthase-like polyprenyltransferase